MKVLHKKNKKRTWWKTIGKKKYEFIMNDVNVIFGSNNSYSQLIENIDSFHPLGCLAVFLSLFEVVNM